MSPRDPYSALLSNLATAIVEQRAIVYVGAGASVPAGGPLWSQLLEWLFEERAAPLLEAPDYRYLRTKLFTEKKYLEAADLLQDVLDNDLRDLLVKRFASVSKPSSIHVNIGRIPFRASITTNYDDLLREACSNFVSDKGKPEVLNWKTPNPILQAKSRYILQTHGGIKVDSGSLILSSREYRKLIHKSPLYWQILKWIFMTHTCLFVGCSLTDPDLLYLFDQVISEIGLEDFGMHYALLPEHEAPEIRTNNLLHKWKIKVIALKNPSGKAFAGEEIDHSGKADDKKWVEGETSRALVSLGGVVAAETIRIRPPALPTSDGHDFFLIDALKSLLQSALEVTGSFRGDICLPPAPGIGNPESADPCFWVSTEHTHTNLEGKTIKRRSVCGIAYHESSPQRGVYIRDVEARDEIKTQSLREDSDIWHWGNIDYLPGHSDVKSELAVPILADGVRVGVLNLESSLKEAYAEGHLKAALWYAEKAGRLYLAAKERDRRGRGLRPEIIDDIKPKFLSVFKTLWNIRNVTAAQDRKEHAQKDDLDCLVFHADYFNGKLVARTKSPNSDTEIEVKFDFATKPAFTCTVFGERSGALCPDAKLAMENERIARTYAQQLDLSGPLIGVPVHVHGYVAGVLVCWHRDGRDGYLDWRDMELFRRASHLIANASGTHFMLKPMHLLYPKDAAQDPPAEVADEKKRIGLATDHIEGVRETMELCLGSKRLVPETRLLKDKDSDESLFHNWLDVASKVGSLLELLWIRYGAEEEYWLVPTRARLWVARRMNDGAGKGGELSTTPVFGLVMEVSLDKEALRKARQRFVEQNDNPRGLEHWTACSKEVVATVRNLFKRNDIPENEAKPTFLTARPLVPTAPVADAQADGGTEKVSIRIKDFIPNSSGKRLAGQKPGMSQRTPLVTEPEPNMSFLLSRHWADRFTRLQQLEPEPPDLKGLEKDPLLKWMEKDEGAPVYAAPLVRILSESFDEKKTELIIENKLSRTRLRELAGILVLDSVKLSKKEFNPPTGESHLALRNELLHTIDLFSGCLAEGREFQRNRSLDQTEQGPQSPGKPNQRAAAAGVSSV